MPYFKDKNKEAFMFMRSIFASKSNREHIAQKYGLSNSCEIVRLFLTSSQREELMEHIVKLKGMVG